MSNISDNRVRQSKRLSNSQRTRPESNQTQTGGSQYNAWNRNDVSRSSPAPRNTAKPGPPAAGSSSNIPATAVEEEHISVRGFNSKETEEYLKKSYRDTIGTDSNKSGLFKSASETHASKAPWGSKPTVMTNGQDFWVQLGKQLAAKEYPNGG